MPSIGEYRVGITFNPSHDPRVDELKRLAASFIDLCRHLRDPDAEGETARLWALAETHIEDAAMWAVKAVTKPRQQERAHNPAADYPRGHPAPGDLGSRPL